MVKAQVEGQTMDMRSDHLIAVLDFALHQMVSRGTEVLDYGANENGLDYEEQMDYIALNLERLKDLVENGHQDIIIVAPDQDQLDKYHLSLEDL